MPRGFFQLSQLVFYHTEFPPQHVRELSFSGPRYRADKLVD